MYDSSVGHLITDCNLWHKISGGVVTDCKFRARSL